MVAVQKLPMSRPLTVADLEAMFADRPDDRPEDGHRYELLDGVLLVSPGPEWFHQRAVGRLLRLLDDACPADLEAMVGPFDIVLAEDTLLQPDVFVARLEDLTTKRLPGAPVLAVEVLSPSTRRYDLLLKRSRFEASGCPSYWVVDPQEPSLRAWDLVDGSYVESGTVKGEELFSAKLPFSVELRPAELVS